MVHLAALLTAAWLAAVELPVEAPILPGATALSEVGRYQSSRSYAETVEYYRRLFARTGGVRWRNIVNFPDLRAKHVASLRRKTAWQGINIYEKQGQVRIYVVPRPESETAEAAKRPTTPSPS